MSEPPNTPRPPASRPAGAWVSIDERVPTPADAGGMSPARRRALAVAILEAAVFVAGMLFGMLVRGGGKGEKAPAPAPPPPPAAAPAAEAAPPAPERTGTANRALEEARAWALEHPEDIKGQIERFLRVAREWDRTPAAEKARREAEDVPVRRRARLLDELVALEEEAAGLEAREEFRDALAVYERSRGRHADPLWGGALDAKIGDLNRRIEGLYLSLKAAAEKASSDRNDAELGKIRERVELWGLEGYARRFDGAFAGAAAAAAPLTAERKAYLELWGKAAALAAARDYDAAAAVVRRYSGSLPSEDLRLEAGLDLEDVRRVAALYDAIREALAKWPPGGGVSLETVDGRKVAGSVWRSDRDRFEVQTGPGRETAFVEYSEIPAGTLLDLFSGRSRGASRDDRAAVLLCLFDGSLEAAKAAAGKAEALPGKYWAFAREARARAARLGGVALKNEEQARSVYTAAEREYRDPRTRSAAVEKYRRLLQDYADTGTVLRAVDRIARRAERRPDLFFAARDLQAGGAFRARRQAAKGLCWVTEEETDFSRARENYVEIEFQAAADSQPRCWFLAGGCCAETFVAFYQASGLTSVRPKSKETVPVEPGSIYGVTLAVPDGARKKHSTHGSAEAAAEPLHWEWIEAPLPKYTAEGIKRVRLMTGRRGLWVARALVSTTRKAPPRMEELRDLEESRAGDLGFDPGEDPDLLGSWSFDEGVGKVLGDSSGNGRMGVAAGDPAWVDGKPGTALFFDGKDDLVLVQDDPGLRLGGDLTLAFRVCYAAESKVRHRLAGKGEENYGVWGFTGNRLLFRQAGADGKPVLEVVSKRAMTPGEWHHVAAVVRGNRGFLYVDGAEDAAAERTGAPALSTAPFSLGTAGHDGSFFGRLDEVRLWGRALSPEEIRALAEEPAR